MTQANMVTESVATRLSVFLGREQDFEPGSLTNRVIIGDENNTSGFVSR